MQKLDTLREYLEYNPNSGEFHWIKSPKNGINIGSLAGTKTGRYKTIHFKRHQYYTHKLAWYFSFGIYPTEVVDHINQNTFDNRIINSYSDNFFMPWFFYEFCFFIIYRNVEYRRIMFFNNLINIL